MKRLALTLIRCYQVAISPALGVRCRYEPSCSVYAARAIERRGVVRGSWAAARRLARCRPGQPGGYDPPDEGATDGDRAVRSTAA